MLPFLLRVLVTAAWLFFVAPFYISCTQLPRESSSPAGPSSLASPDAGTSPLGLTLSRRGETIKAIPGTPFAATVTAKPVGVVIRSTNPWDALEDALIADARALSPETNLPRYTCWSPPTYDYLLEVERAAPDCSEPAIDRNFLEGLAKMLRTFEIKNPYRPDDYCTLMLLTGTVARFGSTEPPAIMFRLFPINQAVGLPEKVPDVTFGEADLEVVRHVKREIIASTTPRDLLLFLGNGGAYFYYSFKPADDRNVHLIPLSGKCMDSGYTDAAPLAKYKAEILVPAFKPGNFDRLILIDHVMTGESLRDFTKLLSSLGFLNKGYFEKLTPYVINLAYSRDLEDAFPGGIPRFQDNVIESKVKILKELTVGPGIEPLFRFDQAKFGRILPSYPRMVWQHSIHDIPNADREVGESIVRQIMADRIGA